VVEAQRNRGPILAELSRELERIAARLEALAAEPPPPPESAPFPFPPGGRARMTAALRRRLAEARRAGKVTQAALARRIGRHPAFVSNYERGERRLEVAEFVEIACALGLDPAAMVAELARP
jgi:DNA-binding XRE family transcriptional regulator